MFWDGINQSLYIRFGYIGYLYVYLTYDIKRFTERHLEDNRSEVT